MSAVSPAAVPSAVQPAGKDRIAGLDGLRAISIGLVFAGHGWATLPAGWGVPAGLATYLGNATLGVTTFFVISGYLITYLLLKESDRTGGIALQDFYARRVLRIFPALYTYLAVVAGLKLAEWLETTWGDIAVAATFLTNYKFLIGVPTNSGYWFVGHFWTLSLEEQFYLLWPLLFAGLGRRSAGRVALLIVVASPPVRVATYLLWPESRSYIGMMLYTAADPLMVGCLAALWCRGPLQWATGRREGVAAVAAGLFVAVVSPWLAVQFRGNYGATVGPTCNALAIACILLWVARNPHGFVTRILSWSPIRYVGVLSYSLYLWQQLFLTQLNTTWSGVFPTNILACFVAANLSYWLIERPFLRLRGRFRPKTEVPPPCGRNPFLPDQVRA